MKKLFYLLLTFLLFIPILISASSYSSATNISKGYINNFLNPSRYIKINSGDLISKEEVEKTIVRPNMTVSSYMYDGTKFWAKDKYVIGETIDQDANANVKTKVTEIVLHDTKVKGTGKYTDPWIFIDTYKVTVFTSANGMIDGQQSATKNVDSNGNVSFTIEPNSGYKYLNNNCGATSEVAGNILTIRNVEKDISCSVSFEASKYSNTLPVPYKTVHINLTNSNVTYRFDDTPKGPSPNTFAAIYLQGYYTDETLKTRIGKLTNIPSRKGWTFNGYYVKRSNFSKLDEIASTDELLINNKGFFETTYSLLKDNTTKEVIGFSIEPNKYKITFNKAGGSGGTSEVVDWPYEHDMPVITKPTRTGWTFYGYFTQANGAGDKYYNKDGTASRIFNPSTLGNLTLYAYWVDDIAPECSVARSHTGTVDGVTFDITCTDEGTGCDATQSYTRTGVKSTPTYTVKDRAGNVTTCTGTSVRAQNQRKTCTLYSYCEHSNCGVKEYNSCSHSECGVGAYKSCATAGCGVATCTKSCCGCQSHSSCRNSSCTCAQYKSCGCGYNTCAAYACGQEPYDCSYYQNPSASNGWCSGESCYVPKTCYRNKTCATSECGPKYCRASYCGCETYNSCVSDSCACAVYNTCSTASCCGYKTCSHPECGVSWYKTCATPGCGVKHYNSCRTSPCGCDTWSNWADIGSCSTSPNVYQCRTIYF